MDMPVKTFLINLDKRPDRLEHVAGRLEQLGLGFQRISAIDGSLLPQDYSMVNEDKFVVETGRLITSGEIGCAESHRLIWKSMIEDNISHALILEDDIDIAESIHTVLDSGVYAQLDFINLSCTKPFRLEKKALSNVITKKRSVRPLPLSKWRATWKRLEGRNRKIFNMFFLSDDLVICECDHAPILASGYIVSQKAARVFHAATDSLSYPIDYVWRYSGGLLRQAFIAEPIIKQTLGDSNILGREEAKRLTVYQKFKRLFLRNRRIRRELNLIKMYGSKVL